jgi:hypothetical protein
MDPAALQKQLTELMEIFKSKRTLRQQAEEAL